MLKPAVFTTKGGHGTAKTWPFDQDVRAIVTVITLIGLLVLLIAAPLWLSEEWVKQAIGILTPIVTLITGYLFGSRASKAETPKPEDNKNFKT